jgi:hypothetical protein
MRDPGPCYVGPASRALLLARIAIMDVLYGREPAPIGNPKDALPAAEHRNQRKRVSAAMIGGPFSIPRNRRKGTA